MAPNHPSETAQVASHAARIKWASLTPEQRAEATAAARESFAQQWDRKVPADITDPEERAQRAAEAKRAHYAGLAKKSAKVRRAKAAARKAAGNAA